MKREFIAWSIAVAVVLMLPSLLCAQVTRRVSRVAMDSLLNPSLRSDADKILLFDNATQNIGTLAESDSPRIVRFAFRNVSDQAVTIARVTTHCGCTMATAPQGPVEVGGTAVITVKYNPKGRSGTIDTNAFVYLAGDSLRPVAKLTILGNVVDDNEWSHLPCVMGDLRLKRTKIAFKNGRTVARIPCANVGTKAVELSAKILPAYAAFATEPQIIQPGEEGDIIITINAAETGAAKCFSVVVDGVKGSISSRTISAVIE